MNKQYTSFRDALPGWFSGWFSGPLSGGFAGWRPAMFGLAAFAGIALGACRQDDGDDGTEASLEVRNACDDYCVKAKECDGDIDEENCYERCLDNMGNCRVDEEEEAIEKLQQCANESCDDFIGCTVEVGAQCYFGL
jgi:hypothetical protein